MTAGVAAGVDRSRLQHDPDLGHSRRSAWYFRPVTVTVPALGASGPVIIRIVVNFPAPFGPGSGVGWMSDPVFMLRRQSEALTEECSWYGERRKLLRNRIPGP